MKGRSEKIYHQKVLWAPCDHSLHPHLRNPSENLRSQDTGNLNHKVSMAALHTNNLAEFSLPKTGPENAKIHQKS